MKYVIFYIIFGLILNLSMGCQDRSNISSSQGDQPDEFAQAQRTVRVIATTGMVGDLVRQVGGEYVTVKQMMGSGVDPHLYKATRDDVQSMMQADLIFYNGLMLEGKLTDTLIKLARKKRVIAVSESIDDAALLEPDQFAGHYDPHVWMDVSTWMNCVDVVAETLAEFDPQHSDDYQANADVYRQELLELHQYGLQVIATIPEPSRLLITSHDAFNYFGRTYHLEVQGVQGLSTESEAGLQRVNELVQTIVAKRVRAVFVESSVPRKSIEALIEGARAQGHEVVVGGELFSDAMGNPGTYEGTYIGMLDHNITLVTRSLGGEAPERGWQDRLGQKKIASQ